MADSQFGDAAVLATDPTFQGRVGSAMFTYCGVVSSEAVAATAGAAYVHGQRKNQVANILANPTSYRALFVNTASCDATILGTATNTGATALTAGNVASQATLVTDTMISNSVASTFNNFIASL